MCESESQFEPWKMSARCQNRKSSHVKTPLCGLGIRLGISYTGVARRTVRRCAVGVYWVSAYRKTSVSREKNGPSATVSKTETGQRIRSIEHCGAEFGEHR